MEVISGILLPFNRWTLSFSENLQASAYDNNRKKQGIHHLHHGRHFGSGHLASTLFET